MEHETLSFRRQSIVNAVAAAAQVVAVGVLYVFLYRFLLDELGGVDFGIWALLLAATAASGLANLGFAEACVYFVAKHLAGDDPTAAARLVQTAALSVAVTVSIVLIALFAVLPSLLELIVSDPSHVGRALRIAPLVFVSYWLTSVSNVFLATIEGCNRADLRSYVTLTAIVAYFALCFLLVPQQGLIGVARAYCAHAIVLFVGAWLVARTRLGGLPLIPYRFSRATFKMLLGYSAGMQVVSVFQTVGEPLTKALVARFGGLDTLGLFEFAHKLTVQLRAVVVGAHRVVVPVISTYREADRDTEVRSLFLSSHQFMQFVVAVSVPLLFALAPSISELWVGRLDTFFVYAVCILMTAWFLNTLANPAYFGYLGEGKVRWPVWSHVVMGTSNVALGFLLGWKFGGLGVVVAYAIALLLGSFMLANVYRREHGYTIGDMYVRQSAVLVAVAAIAAGAAAFVTSQIPSTSAWIRFFAGLAVYAVIVTPFAHRHPTRKAIAGWLRTLRRVG